LLLHVFGDRDQSAHWVATNGQCPSGHALQPVSIMAVVVVAVVVVVVGVLVVIVVVVVVVVLLLTSLLL